MTRFLYHITANPETPEDSVHYFRDDGGRWLAYTFDEKAVAASGGTMPVIPSIAAGAAATTPARAMPEQNEGRSQLLNTLLRQHLNQNLHYDGNYDLPDVPDLSSNSYSSLSLNSAGTLTFLPLT